MKYTCGICGYKYDEDIEGTKWDELDDDWCCPLCKSREISI